MSESSMGSGSCRLVQNRTPQPGPSASWCWLYGDDFCTHLAHRVFAAYGELDPDGAVATHALQPPADVCPAYGGLQIRSSSTVLQNVTDAFEYLVQYPFEYVESLASRALALHTWHRRPLRGGGGLVAEETCLNVLVR